MSAREELAELLHDHLGVLRRYCRETADAILAAGYGKMADAWDESNASDTPWINPYRQDADL